MKEYISLIIFIMFSIVIYSIKMRTKIIAHKTKNINNKKSKRLKQQEQRWRRALERKLNMPRGFINSMFLYECIKKRYDQMNF